MKHLRHALALAALLTLPGLAVAAPQASTGQKAATTKHAMAATHATKGTVTAIDASTLVIARSPKSKHGMTFALEPSTTRQGNLTVGSMVDVRYRTEAHKNIATAVSVQAKKQA